MTGYGDAITPAETRATSQLLPLRRTLPAPAGFEKRYRRIGNRILGDEKHRSSVYYTENAREIQQKGRAQSPSTGPNIETAHAIKRME